MTGATRATLEITEAAVERAREERRALGKKGNARSSGYDREPDEFYTEPPWCADLLFQNVRFSGSIVDPAAGLGTIVRAAKRAGLEAIGSDLRGRRRDQDVDDVAEDSIDFLDDRPGAYEFANIATNPPFAQAVPFIRRALTVAHDRVAMLLPASFLFSQERQALFLSTPVERVLLLSRRPSIPPGRLVMEGLAKFAGGSTDFAWCVWKRGHEARPTVTWIA